MNVPPTAAPIVTKIDRSRPVSIAVLAILTRMQEGMGDVALPGADTKLGSTKFEWWLENVAPPPRK
ncbi:hypothetical protein KX816_06585 [Sphingosinicellaceae bacterium]|nr:hypothetical protein KX816_06585 [Sphingosinicellaceae bacterium]